MWNGFLGCLGKKDIYVGCIFLGCCGVLIFGCGKQYFIFERNMNGVKFSVEIPVEAYLKKFILKKLGCEPYVLANDNYIGQVLLSKLRKKDCTYKQIKPTGTTFKFIIPNKYAENFGVCIINEQNIRNFVRWAEVAFREELFVWMESRFSLKEELDIDIKIKNSIISFCKSYDIAEDEFAYETLKKAIYRRFKSSTTTDITSDNTFTGRIVPQYL